LLCGALFKAVPRADGKPSVVLQKERKGEKSIIIDKKV
jgi:hypothetical protein